MVRRPLVLLSLALAGCSADPLLADAPVLAKRVPFLAERFRSPRPWDRYLLQGEVGRHLPHPDAVRVLEALLDDEHLPTRHQAAVRLYYAAVPLPEAKRRSVLAGFREYDPGDPAGCLARLRALPVARAGPLLAFAGGETDVPMLAAAAREGDPYAGLALVQLGGPAAAEPGFRLAAAAPITRERAWAWRSAVAALARTSPEEAASRAREGAAALASVPLSADEYAVLLRFVAAITGRWPGTEGEADGAGPVAFLAARRGSPDARVRSALVEELAGMLPSELAERELSGRLADADPKVRYEAARALLLCGVPLDRDAARSCPPPEADWTAPGAEEEVVESLRHGPRDAVCGVPVVLALTDPRGAGDAALALALHGDRSDVERIRPLLGARDMETRHRAAAALIGLGAGGEADPLLRDLAGAGYGPAAVAARRRGDRSIGGTLLDAARRVEEGEPTTAARLRLLAARLSGAWPR